MNFDKNLCSKHIASSLNSTSNWRGAKALAYSHDDRNRQASVRLAELANEAGGLADDDWRRLSPHFDPDSQHWLQAVSVACRQIGFARHPQSLSAFVSNLVTALEQPVVQA